MCAINGFNFNNKDLILKMNAITKHRGPDGTSIFCDEDVSLGHNRLSIIDLSKRAAQPMTSYDGSQVIVFNGEIYNFKELKKDLDYPFCSESDTEVILAAYKKWGGDCVKKFNGIFAFAIWDKQKQEIFIARDHIGVKPFYYYFNNGRFIFSSEIKAILEHDIPRVVNKKALNHYLRVLYTPEPLTMLENIYKLPPASCAILSGGHLKITKYWEIKNDYLGLSKSEIIEQVRQKIFSSVKSQLISDRPLGLYLSGGIDSSVILHNMAQMRGNIDTFSVGFSIPFDKREEEKFNKDFYLARETAKCYGTNHNEILLNPQDIWAIFEKAVWHMDEPISNPTAISMMYLAGFAKQKADVVLSGDGGDELFGGYDRYRLDRLARFYMPPIKRFVRFMFQKNEILDKVMKNFDRKISEQFFKKKYFNDKQILMNVDRQSWLVDFSLMLADKMSMSRALEARVPFLDKDLTEFASKIPLKYKVNFFKTKIIIRDAYKGKIPEFLFNQPKRGWFSPGAKWLRYPEFNTMAREVLSENYCQETKPIFKWKELAEVFEKHCRKEEYNLTILWAILTFQVWAKIYNVKLHI